MAAEYDQVTIAIASLARQPPEQPKAEKALSMQKGSRHATKKPCLQKRKKTRSTGNSIHGDRSIDDQCCPCRSAKNDRSGRLPDSVSQIGSPVCCGAIPSDRFQDRNRTTFSPRPINDGYRQTWKAGFSNVQIRTRRQTPHRSAVLVQLTVTQFAAEVTL